MFDKWRLNRKLKAFREGEVKCAEYKEAERTAVLESGTWKTELAFKLVSFDSAIQLAFSGDIVTRDGEALAHVMKAMWNLKLPEFPESDALREQLWGNDPDGQFAGKRAIYFRDMAAYVMGMPNEVRVTTVTSYPIDNR